MRVLSAWCAGNDDRSRIAALLQGQAESSRRPDSCFFGPWHGTQRSARTGRMRGFKEFHILGGYGNRSRIVRSRREQGEQRGDDRSDEHGRIPGGTYYGARRRDSACLASETTTIIPQLGHKLNRGVRRHFGIGFEIRAPSVASALNRSTGSSRSSKCRAAGGSETGGRQMSMCNVRRSRRTRGPLPTCLIQKIGCGLTLFGGRCRERRFLWDRR